MNEAEGRCWDSGWDDGYSQGKIAGLRSAARTARMEAARSRRAGLGEGYVTKQRMESRSLGEYELARCLYRRAAKLERNA